MCSDYKPLEGNYMPTFGVIYLKLYINISTHRNSTHRLLWVRALNTSFSKLIRIFLMNSPQYTSSTIQNAAKSISIQCSPKSFSVHFSPWSKLTHLKWGFTPSTPVYTWFSHESMESSRHKNPAADWGPHAFLQQTILREDGSHTSMQSGIKDRHDSQTKDPISRTLHSHTLHTGRWCFEWFNLYYGVLNSGATAGHT